MQKDEVNEPQLKFGYGIKQAAPLIGISERTLRTLIAEGKIRVVKVRGRTLLRPGDIEAFMEENAV